MAALIVLVLLAACSSTSTGTDTGGTREEAAPSTAASPAPAQTVEVASWDGDDLPPAIGGLTRRGDLGIYFAEVDHRIMLVAIDITNGTELWRQRVHQLGRIPGTVHYPTVDWDRGLVFAARFEPEENPPLFGMFAYDLDGREQWRSGGLGDARFTELCGDDWVCVSLPDGAVHRYHRDSGATALQASGGVGRVIGGSDPWLITANADERLVELGRLAADGTYKRQWRRSFAELFEDQEAGATYTPNGGWYSQHNDDAGTTGVAFATRFGGDDPDAADHRREAELGLAASLVGDDGEVRASWQRVDLCLSNASWRDDAVVLCEDLEVVEDGRVVDGQPAPWFRAAQVSSYRVTDGRQQWTTELPGLVESIVPTSDDAVFVVRPEGAEPVLLDVDDGSTAAPAERPELILACEREYQPDDLYGELITSDGERDRYRRATPEEVWQPCDASGDVVEPAELIATGELTPDWFGYHPDLPDDQEPEGADRWAVWATPDGTLHGAGPAGDARTGV
jgi:hypothetical protein